MRGWVAVGLLCLSLGAVSQPPAPRSGHATSEPQGQAQHAESQSAANHQGATSHSAGVANRPTIDLQPRSTDEKKETRDYSSHEWWLVYLTAILAVVTTFLAVFTFRLWESAQRSALVAKESGERQLRAYVGPMDQHIFGITRSGRLRARVTVKNSGQTPALNVRALMWVYIKPFNKETYTIAPTAEEVAAASMTTIFPRGEYTIAQPRSQDDAPDAITALERQGLFSGALCVHVSGKIIYDDVFKREQTTTFHFKLGGNVIPNEDEPIDGYPLAACNNGNTAT